MSVLNFFKVDCQKVEMERAGRHGSPALHTALRVSSGLLVACVLALLVLQGGREEREERLSADRLKISEKSIHKINSATEKAISKIQKRMMKSLDVGQKGSKVAESKADTIRDQLLKAESDITSLKLSSSNLFAKWERERSIARDAKTTAVSLHEILQQDKTKERMEKRTLEDLKKKLAKELSTADVSRRSLSGVSSRTDLQAYFASLNAQDKLKEQAMEKKNAKHLGGSESGAHSKGKGKGKGRVALKQVADVFDVEGVKKERLRDDAAEGKEPNLLKALTAEGHFLRFIPHLSSSLLCSDIAVAMHLVEGISDVVLVNSSAEMIFFVSALACVDE